MEKEERIDSFLEIKKKTKEIQELYKNDERQNSFNLLLLGESGTGKSFILRTARKPVYIDSFDPGGTKCLRPEIESGDIIADTRWENDDPFRPTVWRDWVKESQWRLKNDFYRHFGTYVIDSCTKWSDAIMNNILFQAGIAGEPPRFTKDYNPQKVQMLNWIKKMMALPCDFVMTGHLEIHKDEAAGTVSYRFMSTGKAVALVPIEFDEIWVTSTKPKASGPEYHVRTSHDAKYLASSRIGRGKFDHLEKPDIKYLLKKAGLSAEDKPKITGD